MCDAGRIKHHLKHHLWNPLNTILFVGYQAPNTLGRRLIDGEKVVKIFGEEIAVNAKIEYLEGYSGHADQEWLMNFIYSFREKPKKVFLVHGEDNARNTLKEKIETEIEVSVEMPKFGDTFRIDEIVEKISEISSEELEKIISKDINFASEFTELNDELSILSSDIKEKILSGETTDIEKIDVSIEILDKVLMKLKAFEHEVEKLKDETNKRKKQISSKE